MGRFRKKPVVIEAWKWDGEQATLTAIQHAEVDGRKGSVAEGPGGCLLVKTLEGDMRADLGDWIIRGVKGEMYPCKPDIFEASYEPA